MSSLLLIAMSTASHGDETIPDAEFLEFLGSWETQDGEWFDPRQLLDEQEKIKTSNESAEGVDNND